MANEILEATINFPSSRIHANPQLIQPGGSHLGSQEQMDS